MNSSTYKIISAIFAAGVMLSPATSAAAIVFQSGFEDGPDVDVTSYTQFDTGLSWLASNTDGERIRTDTGKAAFEGNFYASLLQNSGAYSGDTAIGAFGSTGYDRIYNVFAVDPNTTYTVSFAHAGDDRFGYTADTSVVDVVSMDNGNVFANMLFDTPDLFDWAVETFTFTTDAFTTSIALAFTVSGASNTSGVFDDVLVQTANAPVPLPAAAPLMLLGLGGLLWGKRRASKA